MGGDVFRYWRLKDIERGLKVIRAIAAWWGDNRHCEEEDIANEEARTCELEDTAIEFINTRLAPTTGNFWVSRQTPLTLLDDLTVVEGAFIDTVLARAIPAYRTGVSRRVMDGRYYLPSQRDAWRIIEWSIVNTFPYVSEQYDCDDFTEALRHDFRRCGVNACAIIVDDSGGHAYNILVFADGFWFVEPQRDKIVAIGSGIYELARGIVWV